MPSKERSYACASPARARQCIQCKKQENRIGSMQQNIRKVVACGIQVVNLAVQHVGQPRQRMPVACVKSERPNEAFGAETISYMQVFRDILLIVIIEKGISG